MGSEDLKFIKILPMTGSAKEGLYSTKE